MVVEAAAEIQASLPPPLDLGKASVARSPFAPLLVSSSSTPRPAGGGGGATASYDNSLGTVLKQEVQRFNSLLALLNRFAQGGGCSKGGEALIRSFTLSLMPSLTPSLPRSLMMMMMTVSFLLTPFSPHLISDLCTLCRHPSLPPSLPPLLPPCLPLCRSLVDLGRAMKGLSVMSPELEATSVSLLNRQVPQQWLKASYPSLM